MLFSNSPDSVAKLGRWNTCAKGEFRVDGLQKQVDMNPKPGTFQLEDLARETCQSTKETETISNKQNPLILSCYHFPPKGIERLKSNHLRKT